MESLNNIRGIDMFSGAGGSSWGAREAGVDVVAAFDLWDLAGKVHQKNFPGTRFFHTRLEAVDINQLKAEIGQIDIITASPECTNHSPAKGNKPRCELSKDTAFQVIRFAREFQPRWIVIENVINMRRWSRFKEFRAQLEDLGYNLREQVLNAALFGVPQTRRRLFILADLKRVPEPVKPPKKKSPKISGIVKVNDDYVWTPLRKKGRAKATLQRAERGIAAVGPKKPFLLVYYGSDGAGGWQKLDRPLRTITTVDRFALVKPDEKHGHVMRMLQVPELQAAMGMPATMEFDTGTRRDRIKMIGNAVCPPVMREVLCQLTQGSK